MLSLFPFQKRAFTNHIGKFAKLAAHFLHFFEICYFIAASFTLRTFLAKNYKVSTLYDSAQFAQYLNRVKFFEVLLNSKSEPSCEALASYFRRFFKRRQISKRGNKRDQNGHCMIWNPLITQEFSVQTKNSTKALYFCLFSKGRIE